MPTKLFNFIWYQKGALAKALALLFWPLLWPLAKLFYILAGQRKRRYLNGQSFAFHADVPVIVVGNINIGGTGKSPVTIWLVEQLLSQGYRPGVVSRGYGSAAPQYPYQVNDSDEADVVGDEPLMIHLRTGVPVVVDPNRVAAVKAMLQTHKVDVIISDDGLQHYALSRTLELMVVDAVRGFGNGRLLPLGPLREPVERAQEVDAIVINGNIDDGFSKSTHGQIRNLNPHSFTMELEPGALVPFNHESRVLLESGTITEMQSVAGIGNPQRFYDTLDRLQINHSPKSFADHHRYTASDLEDLQNRFIVTTEKDAVKLRRFEHLRGAYLPVNARLQDGLIDVILQNLKQFRSHHRHRY